MIRGVTSTQPEVGHPETGTSSDEKGGHLEPEVWGSWGLFNPLICLNPLTVHLTPAYWGRGGEKTLALECQMLFLLECLEFSRQRKRESAANPGVGPSAMTTQVDMESTNCILVFMQRFRGSRKLVLLIVAIALLLDNMLLSSVVPIIPAYLYELHHARDLKLLNVTDATTSYSATTEAYRFTQSYDQQKCNCSQDQTTRDEETTTTDFGATTTLSPDMKELRHHELIEENVEVGIMFASKPIVQAITNPFIGPLTNKIGYSIPMFCGFVIMFFSTLIFAMGTNYPILFVARSLQGVGSACTSVAGMGMLAAFYPDDRERGNAMALALGGLALGVMIGPPFGGVMYEFVGRAAPFLVLAFISLFDGLLQLLVLQPKVTKETQEGASLLTLIKDPYILIAAGAITFANMGIATLEPSLPLWMMDTMNAPKWQQGAAFLPASISYLIGTNLFGPLGHRMGRWFSTMVGLIVIGICLMLIPMARNITHLIVPNAGIGFAIGMVDSSMMPMLGYLVDIRHTSVYGSVYAIGDVAFCVGFAIGPLLSGSIVKAIGFEGLVYCIAIICFIYAPLLFLLRKPPGRPEDQTALKDTAIRYVSYTNDESPDEEECRKPPPQAWCFGSYEEQRKTVTSIKIEARSPSVMTTQEDTESTNCILVFMQRFRGSRKLVVLIVAIAILLDNMLLTSVIPIIPAFLYELHHANDLKLLNVTNATTSYSSVTTEADRSYDQHTTRDDEMTTTEFVATTTLSPDMKEVRHDELVEENLEVGIMFASKPIVQAIVNPFIGPLTNKIGYSIPMFCGFVIMFFSALIFAMGTSYPLLFVARSFQGVGSACTSVAGMGMLAALYPDDRERGKAMGIALGGLALGVILGPPFGGVLYEFVGRAAPFLVLAFISLFDGLLQLLVLQPQVTTRTQEGASLLSLIKDPYILIAAGAIAFANMAIATLECSLPLWMMDTMNAPKWQQGAAFLPPSISYLIGTNLFGPLGHRMGRWFSTMVGLIAIGICLMLIPMTININQLIAPNAGIGFAIGMVDSSMMPMLGYLVDIRHTSVYGSVYAIGDVAFCVGYAIGPLLSGSIVKAIGFEGLVYCLAIICFIYAPLLFLLRKPPGRPEDQTSLKDTDIKYVSYTNEESPKGGNVEIHPHKHENSDDVQKFYFCVP
ncbi:hypothetical protein JTE90_002947 [Oedothorax gibbosus]|uniref:Major facilitator superfamily (MFS) profile domain-containing protein n=1 Tax=Oedothorax gibbosus TaxID=931172 RepID=A0AAV6UH57_9ARAC|nr:hypothetical protein JTE90_002947 [Oedothorax gibbosus]